MFDLDGRIRLTDEPVVASVLLAGDLCPINRLGPMLASGDLVGAFGDCRELFGRADLTVVNLEAPLCRREAPLDKLGPNFRGDPAIAAPLADLPVHVACLANNHTMDQGVDGLLETLDALDEAGIQAVGAARVRSEARGPLVLDVAGLRVALVNTATVEGAVPPDGPGPARIDHLADRRAVADAAADCDLVIPIVHTGKEQVPFPSPGLQQFFRELADAGAAAVVGHHPHVPQGIELHAGRPIAYSLGNFLFDWHEPEPETASSFLLELGLGPSGVAELAVHPFAQTEGGGVDLLRGERRAEYVALLADLSEPLTRPDEVGPLWREQCRALFDTWYRNRLPRGADIGSDDPEKRMRAWLTFLNILDLNEHGWVLYEGLLQLATGTAREDPGARRTIDNLLDRLKGFAPPWHEADPPG
ncbi:MAG: CapA family protein [Planctomycetota bacterium]